jgi:hypothetical protein
MKLKDGFVIREVCGKNVIVGEGLEAINFGKLLTLNETAAWLWKKCEELGEFTVEELADELCQEYNVSTDEARQDVSETITVWQHSGVLEL